MEKTWESFGYHFFTGARKILLYFCFYQHSSKGPVPTFTVDPIWGLSLKYSGRMSQEYSFNPSIRVELFWQEINGESFGICKSDMLVSGHDPEQIAFGNTLPNDAG